MQTGLYPDSLIIKITDPAFEKALARYDSDHSIDGKVIYGDVKNIDTLTVHPGYKSGNSGVLADKTLSARSLDGIEYLTNLKYLKVDTSLMPELDLRKNPGLEYLDCSGYYETESVKSGLKALYFGANNVLSTLICNYTLLTELPTGKFLHLTKLDCGASSIESLDLTKNTNLEFLATSLSKIKTLDISKNPKLVSLKCMGIESLDLSQNVELTYLNAWYYGSKTLDLCDNEKLADLFIGGDIVENIVIPSGLQLGRINKNTPNATVIRCP
jgi:hypothetical protein